MADLSKYGTVTTAGPGRGGYAPVDISKYGTVSKATENPNQPFSEKYPQLGAVVGAAGDFAQSAGSSAFESIMGAYKLIRMVPGVGDRLPPPSEFTEALTHGPDTIAGHAGKMVESMGEFMIPAGKVEQMQKGASLIARMAGQGGAAGVVRMIQSGGDVGSSLDTAAMGAAGPVIGGVIGAMTPKAVELAKAAGMKIGLSVAGRLTGLPIKGIHDLIVRGAGIAPEVAAAIGKDAELLDGIAQGYGYKSFAKVPESGQQLIRNQATTIANSIAGEAAPVAAAPVAVPPAGVTPSGPVRPPVATAAQMMREAETFSPPETFVPGGPLRPPVRPAPASAATPAAAAAPAEMPALEQITEWLASRDGGTASRFTDPVVSEAPITKQTLGDIMDRLMKNRKASAEVPAATVPAEVPPAAVPEIVPPDAVATPQPATPAPSAAGKPVTAATLMEEATKPATQVNNPNYDWRASEGITAEFKQYLKDSGFDVVPDRPEFDPTNPKAQGKFGGSAKTQVNMDAKANRFVEYLKANKMEPTPDNVARATQTLGEADHPSAHTLEKIYTQMGYDALDVEELLARSMPKVESPAASAAPNPLASAPEVPKAAAKPTAKPRSKQTTVGELMEKAKSAEQSNIHASEVSFDTPRSVSGKKEIRVYSQDPEGTGMHVTKDGVQRMLTIVEAPGGVGRYQVIAKPVGGGVSYQPGYSSLAEKPVKAATETIGGSYSLQDAKKVAESYAKGNPHPFEAVERGVPISAYEPKNKPIKFVESRFSSGGFNNQNIEGANVWTDGAAAFSGKAPGPLSTLEKQPNIKGIWEDAAKTSATPAKAVGSFLEDGRHRIVFDNGTQIDGQYYDWVNKKYPSAEFRVGKNVKDVVTVWKDGKQVGVISPLRPGTGYELPNNIKQMMPKVKK